MLDKTATTSQPIIQQLAARWSPRAFDPTAVISNDQVSALAEAARWAPSCFGAEPWSFVLCNRETDEATWKLALASLAEQNQAWAQNCPLLIAACARLKYEFDGSDNAHCLYDTGAAAFSLVLQAEALGLRAHQMGGFNPDTARTNLQVPEEFKVIAMIAVGKQASAEQLPEGKMREMEVAERTRKNIGSIFFAGKWGSAIDAS